MNLDPATGRWLDDRGQNQELYALVQDITRQATGLDVPIGKPKR